MGNHQSRTQAVVPVGLSSPVGRTRSRDTVHVLSQVVAASTADIQRKDLEVQQLREELSRLSDIQNRMGEIIHERDKQLEEERSRNQKLTKTVKKLQNRADVDLVHTDYPTRPYKSVGSPDISRESSLASQVLIDDNDSQEETASEEEEEMQPSDRQKAALVYQLEATLTQIRLLWEDIWSCREQNGEDPHNPMYDDDYPTSRKIMQATSLCKDIGMINRHIIVNQFNQKLDKLRSTLSTDDTQNLFNQQTKRARINFDSPQARTIDIRMNRYVTNLLTRLVENDKKFIGKLITVGSYTDRTKIGSPNEIDFLYVLTHPELKKLSIKSIGPDTYEVIPAYVNFTEDWAELLHDGKLEIYNPFAQKIEALLRTVPLPPGIEYGGIDGPKPSGVRKNQPAITLHFCCRGQPLSIDITVALFAPPPISGEVLRRLPMHVKFRMENSVTTVSRRIHSLKNMIMIVQAGGLGQWKATTAVFEAHLLRTFKFNSQIIKLIVLLKIINDDLLSIHPARITQYFQKRYTTIQDDVVKSLRDESLRAAMCRLWQRQDHENLVLYYLALRDLGGTNTRYRIQVQTEWKDKLLARPSSIQTYIHPTLQCLANEKVLSLVSSSSCIFKYLVIALYVHNKIDFLKEDCTQVDSQYILDVMKTYSREIRRKDAYRCYSGSIQHPFLRFYIPVRSIRNNTTESLSGVHELGIDKLGSLQKWMSKHCNQVLEEKLGKKPTKNSTTDDYAIYEDIYEDVSKL